MKYKCSYHFPMIEQRSDQMKRLIERRVAISFFTNLIFTVFRLSKGNWFSWICAGCHALTHWLRYSLLSACYRCHILHVPYTRNAVRCSSLSSLCLCLSERVYFCFRAFPIPRESHRFWFLFSSLLFLCRGASTIVPLWLISPSFS